MPPELVEIKRGLALSLVYSLFLEDAWMTVLHLPAFPSRRYFGWEGAASAAQGPAGLAERGRVSLPWVFQRGRDPR